MSKVVVEIQGNTATWLIGLVRKHKWTQSQLAATIFDVARSLDEQGLLVLPNTPPTVDANVTATLQLDLIGGQRVYDPEGEPGVVLKLFNIALDGEPVALVLKTEEIDSEVDLSQVRPEDCFVWRQADLDPNT